jgi:hypothetical protein
MLTEKKADMPTSGTTWHYPNKKISFATAGKSWYYPNKNINLQPMVHPGIIQTRR